MIQLHRLNGVAFFVNHRNIEIVESNPDTVIMLMNEHKYIVREKPEEIEGKIIMFERKIFQDLLPPQPK